jgi:hypothetical protein
MYRLPCLVSIAPVVGGSHTILADVEVLGVVYVSILTRLYTVNYPWLEVDEDGPWDVSCVVALVVKDIFAVAAFGRKVLEVPVLVDAMFLAKLLPELTANVIAALARLNCDYLSVPVLEAVT